MGEYAQGVRGPLLPFVGRNCKLIWQRILKGRSRDGSLGVQCWRYVLTVVKAFVKVEELAWRLYDEAFREKMAATGIRKWNGMDMGLYQEVGVWGES